MSRANQSGGPWRRLLALAALLAAALGLLACPQETPLPEPPLYHTSAGGLRDTGGHFLLLRGINVHGANKHAPEALVPLAHGEVELLLASGFSAVRLLTSWRAIMPERGHVDEDYLRRLAAEVDKLADAGLYVVIDMHQDLWGDAFGNGAPAWACPEEVKAGYEATSPWWLNYLSPQVSGCFDLLWTDADLRQELVASWRAAAGAVCDQQRVVGFDLLNEPWPGGSLGEAAFDQLVLYERFYREAIDAVEAVCPGRIYFLEPSRAYDLGLSDPLAFAAADKTRAVLAPHFYPASVHEPGAGYDGDAAALQEMFDHLYRGYLDDGVPLWLGEWGGIVDNPGFDLYLEDLTRLLFSEVIGAALWVYNPGGEDYSFSDQELAPRPAFARSHAVPVPVALPDRPESVDVDFDRACTRVVVRCVQGRALRWLLPGERAWEIGAEPADALQQGPSSGRFAELTCQGAGRVEVELRALP